MTQPYGPNDAPPASDFLGRLCASERDALHALGKRAHFAKGEYVFRAGGPGKTAYFLVNGRMKIWQPAHNGRAVLLWFCFAGEIFGLAEMARGGGREVNAQACEASDVLIVPQDDFRSFLRAQPDAALLCMEVLASRLRLLGDVLVNLVSDDVHTRIAKLILRLSARYGRQVGGEIYLSIPLTHQEIADMVGTSRQTVTSALTELRKKGVLWMDSRRIHIENEQRLAEITHPG